MVSAEQKGLIERLLTRRALLKVGGATVAAVAVPEALLTLTAEHHGSHLRRASYHRLVGQRFSVTGSRTKLTLAAIEDLNAHQAGSDNAFALVFAAHANAQPLSHQVVELHHPALGRFEFLLSGGTASSDGRAYVAVINRLHR